MWLGESLVPHSLSFVLTLTEHIEVWCCRNMWRSIVVYYDCGGKWDLVLQEQLLHQHHYMQAHNFRKRSTNNFLRFTIIQRPFDISDWLWKRSILVFLCGCEHFSKAQPVKILKHSKKASAPGGEDIISPVNTVSNVTAKLQNKHIWLVFRK